MRLSLDEEVKSLVDDQYKRAVELGQQIPPSMALFTHLRNLKALSADKDAGEVGQLNYSKREKKKDQQKKQIPFIVCGYCMFGHPTEECRGKKCRLCQGDHLLKDCYCSINNPLPITLMCLSIPSIHRSSTIVRISTATYGY